MARPFHTENRKWETNLSDKGGLAMESGLGVGVEEGLVKCAEGGVEGDPSRMAEGGVELAVLGLVVRCD